VYRRSDRRKVALNRQRIIHFSMDRGTGNYQIGTGFFVHNRILSAVRTAQFISDRMSYIILRGHWCNIIVLNVHVPCEDKRDDVKDSFYDELGHF
jgi:hypothetical protein